MDRKSESKSNLNESTLPLLEDEANKEKIELEQKSSESNQEKPTEGAQEDAVDAAKKKKEEEKERKRQLKLEDEEKKKQQKQEKQKKKEEEKELKKQQKAEKVEQKKAAQEAAKSNGTANNASANNSTNLNLIRQTLNGANLLDRDEKSINQHVNISFEDILGEPDATQAIDGVYSVSYGVFHLIRFWVYKILSIFLALPFAIVWGVVFAVLSLLSVWILTPAMRVLDIVFYYFHRVWNAWVRTLLDPIFISISLARQNGAAPVNQTPTPTFSGKVFKCGGVSEPKYSQLSTSETIGNYTKLEDEDKVVLNIESSQN